MGNGGTGEASKMVAISYGNQVRLWGISEDGNESHIGLYLKPNFKFLIDAIR